LPHRRQIDSVSHELSNGYGHSSPGPVSRSEGKSPENEARITESEENHDIKAPQRAPKLLVWSASNRKALEQMTESYQVFYQSRPTRARSDLDALAYTLTVRRSHLLWRTFAVVDDGSELCAEGFPKADPVRSSDTVPGLVFVFTGQGAQYAGMGLELVKYRVFEQTLSRINTIYAELGCTWSVYGMRFSPIAISLHFGCS
jgi:acyl transferase domain-containing protein